MSLDPQFPPPATAPVTPEETPRKTRRLSIAAIIAVVVAIALGGTAFGVLGGKVEKLSAGAQLAKSFEQLGDATSTSVKIEIPLDEAQWSALLDDSQAPAGVATALSQMSLHYTAYSSDGSTPLRELSGVTGGSDGELTLNVGGEPLASLRILDERFYVQVDVDEVLDIAEAPADVRMLLPMAAGGSDALAALLGGQWVTGTTDDLERFSGGAQAGGANGKLPAEVREKALKALYDASEITRDGDTFTVVTDAGDLAAGVVDLIPGLDDDIDDLPSGKVTTTIVLRDGRLHTIETDLGSISDGEVDSLPIRITFDSEVEKVVAPEGAVELDESDLGGAKSFLPGAA